MRRGGSDVLRAQSEHLEQHPRIGDVARGPGDRASRAPAVLALGGLVSGGALGLVGEVMLVGPHALLHESGLHEIGCHAGPSTRAPDRCNVAGHEDFVARPTGRNRSRQPDKIRCRRTNVVNHFFIRLKSIPGSVSTMTPQYADCLPRLRSADGPSLRERTRSTTVAPPGSLHALIREPWLLCVRSGSVLLRPSSPRDLEAVAAMHARCSPQSLLDRYRRGGRGPSVATLQRTLRAPMTFVVATRRGAIVALGTAAPDAYHARDRRDRRDRRRRLATGRPRSRNDIAPRGSGCGVGFNQLVAYAVTTIDTSKHLLSEVGTTRVIADTDLTHLHTHLPESAALGLGAVRDRLAG